MAFEIFKRKPVNLVREFYAMQSEDTDSIEITMYGQIVEQRPTDWWTGEPVPGDFIILDDFLADLEEISGYKSISIRLNTYGGDCVTAFVIHNRLRELSREGAHLTCIVDGVAMSAGTVIMSACDTVKVNPASLIMIHKCWSTLFGGYNADELRELADQHDAYDKAIISAYVRKTGLSATVLSHMMSETTYLTGKEALEKGFADELIEDAEPLDIAASADGRVIYCRDRQLHLAPGMFAPDIIPTVSPGAAEPEDKNMPEDPGKEEGGSYMTLAELRESYPDLIAEVETGVIDSGRTEAVNAAVEAERTRLSEIDAIASQFPADMVQEAKYGENRCSAQELAYRAVQQAAAQGRRFLADAEADCEDSNAAAVESAPAPQEDAPMSDAQKQAAADDFFARAVGKKEV